MKGIGNAYLLTTELGDGTGSAQNLYPNAFFSFNYEPDVTELEALGYVSGIQQTVASAEGSITHNFTLETQYFTFQNQPIITGHTPKTFTATWQVLVETTVPTGSPYEIADANITVANLEEINVYDVTNGPLTHTADAITAPADATEVQVDTTNNKLIFHSTAAGNTIQYTSPTVYTSKSGFGGAGSATSLGRLSFRGQIYGWATADDQLIEFPALDLVGRPSINFAGDVPTFTIPFKAAVPSGWSHPYRMLKIA